MYYLDTLNDQGLCKRQRHKKECDSRIRKDVKRDYHSGVKKITTTRPDKTSKQVLDAVDDSVEAVFDENGERRPINYLESLGISKRKEKHTIYNKRKRGKI